VARRRQLRQGCLLRLRPPCPGLVRRRPGVAGGSPLGYGSGQYILDWDDVRESADPHAAALEFFHSVFAHACTVCEWDPELAASVDGTPPPVV